MINTTTLNERELRAIIGERFPNMVDIRFEHDMNGAVIAEVQTIEEESNGRN